MVTKEFADTFARHWIEAWNSHNLEEILSHYSDDFDMTSPYIITIMNEPGGNLKGKDKVGHYWSVALHKFPNLQFKLINTYHSINSIIIHYHSVHRNTDAAEFFLFGPNLKVIKSIGHY